ncbi:hypothetical protein PHMEG_0007274 [Phytophthora megakarya]|uniref:Uncharacterized protein n=1 Tax=Phytophthora megakarya TaxID=4795 RepID=A0A225WN94_9STRA|nr:hypothetical protein PHMEG_0007274 [Phytophthora megakarya]
MYSCERCDDVRSERVSGLSRAGRRSTAALKQQLSLVFLPPNHVYRVRSRFLACRQDKTILLALFKSYPARQVRGGRNGGIKCEYNFKSAHASWSALSASIPEGPEPMDLSSAEEQVAALRAEVAELRASGQRPSVLLR